MDTGGSQQCRLCRSGAGHGQKRTGRLAEIAGAVGEARGNITNIKTLSRSRDFFDMAFDIEVVDVRHLSNIVAALKTCDRVVTAERARYE